MRNIVPILTDWRFRREDVGLPESFPEDWEPMTLPHTWNAVDGMAGGGYYRGVCWYARTFEAPVQPLPGGRVYLEFLGAGNEATVYVNGKEVCHHKGGYSAFRCDVTDALNGGANLLAVACNNAEKTGIYPQSADFTFYGGLYRAVNLISVPEAHFDLDYFGGPGVRVTPKRAVGGALFAATAFPKNVTEQYRVTYTVFDPENGEAVGFASRPALAPEVEIFVPDAKLWSIDAPHLYDVAVRLELANETVDEVTVSVGVRDFSVDPQKGFFLNGVSTPLRGVCRHQDRLYKGNALTEDDHFEDAALIKEIGANTVRLAHYQHAQEFYELCDTLGLVVWAEIPFISVFDPSPEAHENCVSQLTELIVQNYHHPSICFWGISNEILIGGISEQLVENHRALVSLAKELDPTRLTTLAHVSMTPTDGPMHTLTDVESYNIYFGWYGGRMEDNGPWLDAFHEKQPNVCLGVSEYGCEGILTYHSAHPACKDYSEEYQALYHEHMAQVFEDRPWIWATHVWNMFDFGSAVRDEGGVKGRNNKGLVTIDRNTKKDAFYVYQAFWSKEPMVHIAGKRYAERAGETTQIRVYSNAGFVRLTVNGQFFAKRRGHRVFVFDDVPLRPGLNQIVAEGDGVKDTAALTRVEQEPEHYTLPQVRAQQEGVKNWFTLVGDLDLKAPMSFPKGKWSVRDKVSDIAECPEAFAVLKKATLAMSGAELSPESGMWGFIKNQTVENMIAMGGGSMPEGFLESINAQLTEIDKP